MGSSLISLEEHLSSMMKSSSKAAKVADLLALKDVAGVTSMKEEDEKDKGDAKTMLAADKAKAEVDTKVAAAVVEAKAEMETKVAEAKAEAKEEAAVAVKAAEEKAAAAEKKLAVALAEAEAARLADKAEAVVPAEIFTIIDRENPSAETTEAEIKGAAEAEAEAPAGAEVKAVPLAEGMAAEKTMLEWAWSWVPQLFTK